MKRLTIFRNFSAILSGLIIALLMTGQAGAFFGSHPTFASAYQNGSCIVAGRVEFVEEIPLTSGPIHYGKYRVKVSQWYRGPSNAKELYFVSAGYKTDAELPLVTDAVNVLCLGNSQDRKRTQNADVNVPADSWEVLWAEEFNEANTAQLGAAMKLMDEYIKSDATGRKTWLLKRLQQPNRYLNSYAQSEILVQKVTEAIPILRPGLNSGTEEDRLSVASSLRCLGDQQAFNQVLGWLKEGRWTNRRELIIELERWNRKEAIPLLHSYAGSKDALLAVTARTALYSLGEDAARSMLFDSLKKANEWVVRINAIHALEYVTRDFGRFSTEEVSRIRELAADEDDSIRRGAKSILELVLKKYVRESSGNF